MARNISFMLTTDQIREQTKTVTRRTGWEFVKVGDVLNACVKCMGLKKGEKIQKLALIRVTSVIRERLDTMRTNSNYGDSEARKEGFPTMSGSDFVSMFCKHMRCPADTTVTRIEFEYLP